MEVTLSGIVTLVREKQEENALSPIEVTASGIVTLVKELQEKSGGLLKLMTMAPELEGAQDVLNTCKALGIKVSMGHTDATFEEAQAGVDGGFTRATHTYNAMRPLNHRDAGILGLALTDDRVMCELICDLHHVSAPAVKIVVRCKGPENVTMISDNSFYAGMPEGEYCGEGGSRRRGLHGL